MTLDKNIRVGIITSIVATFLFIYFLGPILNFFGRYFLRLAILLYSGYVDGLFEKAALCSTFDSAFIIQYAFLAFLCGTSFGYCNGLVARAIRKKRGSQPLPISFFTKLSLAKKITLALVLTIVLHFLTILSLWDGWFQRKTISSFNQHMRAVAPYLDEQEEENLWSQWTQMRTRQDYDKIYVQLRSIADKNALHLPENKVYSPTSL